MDNLLGHIVNFSISRVLLALGVSMLVVTMPLVSSLIDYTGAQVEGKSNIAEVNNMVDGVSTTYETKKQQQYPYLTSSQVYFDIVNYSDEGTVQIISDTYVFDKDDLQCVKAADNTSQAYQKVTALFSTLTDDDRFVKVVDGDRTIYEQVF